MLNPKNQNFGHGRFNYSLTNNQMCVFNIISEYSSLSFILWHGIGSPSRGLHQHSRSFLYQRLDVAGIERSSPLPHAALFPPYSYDRARRSG